MFFDLPSVLQVFLKDGPLRQVVDGATKLLADERQCAIHIVTVPEALAVNETIHLHAQLRKREDLHLGYLFINRVSRAWLDDAEMRLVENELAGPSAGQPWARELALAQYLAQRRLTAERCMRGLHHDIDLPTMTFEAQDEGSATIIAELSAAIERAGIR
jgi:hypothetical protein